MFEHLLTWRALALLLCLSAPAGALALENPRASRLDHRVRYVNYHPADVIQLDAVIGVATHIQLEPGESYVYHVFGDSQAYAFTYKNNHLFFKPTAEDADTNLIVITDRRDYSFRLSYSDNRGSPALYKLVIRYPEVEARQRAQAAQKAALERALQTASHPINWTAYTRSGDAAIAPVHAWDDGRQTWLQFAPEADIPTVYRVTPDGQEVITNHHMADERTMVLHRTAAWATKCWPSTTTPTAAHPSRLIPAPPHRRYAEASRARHPTPPRPSPRCAFMRSRNEGIPHDGKRTRPGAKCQPQRHPPGTGSAAPGHRRAQRSTRRSGLSLAHHTGRHRRGGRRPHENLGQRPRRKG
jgi:type IV secretion system protein VirB9